MSYTNLLVLLAQGESEAPAKPSSLFGGSFLIPMVLVVVIFYVVLILPERKKQKQREAMLGGMKKGDKVMTNSGLYGSITQVQDDVVTLQVADGVRLRFNRAAIQTILAADEPASSATT